MAFPKFPSYMAILRKPNMLTFGMFPTGTDLTWIDGTDSGGGGGVPVYTDLTSLVNGSNVNFTLSGTPGSADLVALYWNGIRQKRTIGFNITGANITTTFTPQVGDYLWAYHYA